MQNLLGLGSLWIAACVSLLCAACGSDVSETGDGSGGSGGGSGSGASTGSGGGLPACDVLCVDVVAEGCANGPPDQNACVQGCEMVRNGPCSPEYQTLADCAGSDPDYACNAEGYVVVTGCETHNAALMSCLAAGGG